MLWVCGIPWYNVYGVIYTVVVYGSLVVVRGNIYISSPEWYALGVWYSLVQRIGR